ncbi:MAG: hypothetical protein WCR54_02950 [Clostridia bacterium]
MTTNYNFPNNNTGYYSPNENINNNSGQSNSSWVCPRGGWCHPSKRPPYYPPYNPYPPCPPPCPPPYPQCPPYPPCPPPYPPCPPHRCYDPSCDLMCILFKSMGCMGGGNRYK